MCVGQGASHLPHGWSSCYKMTVDLECFLEALRWSEQAGLWDLGKGEAGEACWDQLRKKPYEHGKDPGLSN